MSLREAPPIGARSSQVATLGRRTRTAAPINGPIDLPTIGPGRPATPAPAPSGHLCPTPSVGAVRRCPRGSPIRPWSRCKTPPRREKACWRATQACWCSNSAPATAGTSPRSAPPKSWGSDCQYHGRRGGLDPLRAVRRRPAQPDRSRCTDRRRAEARARQRDERCRRCRRAPLRTEGNRVRPPGREAVRDPPEPVGSGAIAERAPLIGNPARKHTTPAPRPQTDNADNAFEARTVRRPATNRLANGGPDRPARHGRSLPEQATRGVETMNATPDLDKLPFKIERFLLERGIERATAISRSSRRW